jgi:hypothetical protein
MPNPTRPQYQEIIESSWGRAVADTVVRRYSSTAERDADLAGIPVDELEGQVVAIAPGSARAILAQFSHGRWNTDSAWIAPAAYLNNWRAFTGRTPGYRLIGGLVYLRGGISGGSMNLAAFNLPVGYRPAEAHAFVVRMASSPESVATLAVGAGGDIVPQATSGAWNNYVSLDGVVFDPDSGTSTTRPGIEEDLGDELDEGGE